MEPCSITEKLLQFNLGASGFQFLLGFFSFSLGKAFLNSLRSAVDEVFGFLQAEAGQFADSLNNLNFVSADFFQNDVEFGAAPAPAGEATATAAAAAETPNFSSIILMSSETSRTDMDAIASRISSLDKAILVTPIRCVTKN